MKTRIFIVRHTETIGNVEHRLTGREDYEVTKHGEVLIQKLTQELKNIKFDKIYSSTSKRTFKTIEPLSKLNKVNVIRLDNLCEMYFGIYDGWKWEDVNKVQPEIRENQKKINEIYGIENQESMQEVAERIYNCITDIAHKNPSKTILICSHGVAIEAFMRKIQNNLPFTKERKKFCQYNVAINELIFENNIYTVKRMADVQYLLKE